MSSANERVTKIIGLGADGRDGHVRVTDGGHYALFLGSERSHELMQAWCAAIDDRLLAMNKQMDQLTIDEFVALAREVAPRS
jgi:hypothetical protein